MKIKIGIIVIILLSVAKESETQSTNLKFSLITGTDGKPLGKIRNMTQDQYGYMWFSGEDKKCVYRYDGVRTVTYKHDANNPNSPGDININSVYADKDGKIWIGHQSGLDQLNPATGIFKHYRYLVNNPDSILGGANSLLRDRENRFWIGTDNGLDLLDEKTGKFIHYQNVSGDSRSLSCNRVWNIYEDHQGVIWIGTGYPWDGLDENAGGLNRLDPDGKFTRYMHDPNNPHSLINNKVRAIFEDSRGIFWIGTAGDGLHTMDRRTGNFDRHLYNAAAPDELSRPRMPTSAWHKATEQITFILEDAAGAIWIGTMWSGINRYDTATRKTTHFYGSNGFPDSSCWNAFQSSDGELWFSTQENNLYRVDPSYKPLHNTVTRSQVTEYMEDKAGNLWVATKDSGLIKYDSRGKLVKQFRHDPKDASSVLADGILAFYRNGENEFWVGTNKGLDVLNVATGKFSRFPDNGYLSDSTADSGIGHMIKDNKGMMWFATFGGGLISLDLRDSSFTHFKTDPNDSASLVSDFILPLIQDKSGAIWVGTIKGLELLNKDRTGFKHYLTGIGISSFYEDKEEGLWAGTEDGLYKYNQKEDKFQHPFDPHWEINALRVGGIVEDNAQNLWMVSPSSIIKLNPSIPETFMYGGLYGININSMAPWASNYKNKKGQLFIGYDYGFYTLSPEDLNVKTELKILLTDLLINSRSVLSQEGSTIKKPIEEMSDLILGHNQNNITLHFAAIDYHDPEAIRYYTMLENYDDTWREARMEKSSYYFSIPSGHYVYHVKAINSNGTVAEKILTIRVNPPWWKTWWAYSIYGLIFLMMIFLFYRAQRERIVRKERHRAQMKELEQAREIERAYTELKSTQALLIQAEKMASLGELTAGIAHEIQNPLNFVNNFSDVNMELLEEMKGELDKGNVDEVKAIANDVIDNQGRINHHGKRAEAIVKGMLQHSRPSTGQKEPTNINALCDEYLRLAYHGLRAKENSFQAKLETDFDPSISTIMVIPEDIGRVVLNLINNAFYALAEKKKKHGDQYDPTVTISTKRIQSGGQDSVQIRVKDNGNGVPQKILDKIFQPFFTTKPTGQGTGLGLSLSYDIVKAHGGDFKVESVEGEGAEFVIELPAP